MPTITKHNKKYSKMINFMLHLHISMHSKEREKRSANRFDQSADYHQKEQYSR